MSEAVLATESRYGEVAVPRQRGRMFLGLRGQVILLYLFALVVVIGATVALTIISLTDALNDEYRERALAIIRTTDAQNSTLAAIHDTAQRQAEIDRLASLDPAIFKISLYVPVGNEVIRTAGSDRGGIGQVADPVDAEPIRTGRPVFRDKVRSGERLVEVLAPLHVDGAPVASMGVYLRLAPWDEAVRVQALRMGTNGLAAALVLLVVLYFFLNRLLLQPLHALKRSALRIEQGELDARVDVTRSDELGDLAAAFNSMAASLHKHEAENKELHEQLQRNFDKAQAQAITDPVTELYNHRHFQDRLANELERARRFSTPVALLFIDIDHFKVINDAYGHQFGDQILRELADLLKSTVREIDIVARYGGEEFAAVLPATFRKGGQRVGERIRQAVAAHNFGANREAKPRLTVCVGVAAFPEDSNWREDLIWKADHAMYHAKRLGRNQVRTYSDLWDLAEADTDQGRADAEKVYQNLVHSLATAVDAREHYTGSHSENVARYATAIARAMGLDGKQLRNIGVAGLLHDVGKIGIPDTILSKAGPLSADEWQKMREHPGIGEMIVKQVLYLDPIVPLIAGHHEAFDGQGYPRGLRGEDIPLGARIIAVADAYHSMTSNRPYRAALSPADAATELRRVAGSQLDPSVVEAFLRVLDAEVEMPAVTVGDGKL